MAVLVEVEPGWRRSRRSEGKIADKILAGQADRCTSTGRWVDPEYPRLITVAAEDHSIARTDDEGLEEFGGYDPRQVRGIGGIERLKGRIDGPCAKIGR